MKMLRLFRQLTIEVIAVAPRQAVISLVLTFLLTATEGISLLMLVPLLDLVGVSQRTTMPKVESWFAAIFDFIGVAPTLGGALMLFILVAAVRALIARSQAAVTAVIREDISDHLRGRVYRAIARTEWAFFVTRQPSEFVHVLTGEIAQVGAAAAQFIGLIVLTAVSAVYLGLAFHLSVQMAGLVLVCSGGLAWAARGRLDSARALGKKAGQARKRLHTAIAEHIGSMKTAKSYGMADRHGQIFTSLSGEMKVVSLQMQTGESDLQVGLEFGSTVLLALIVYVSFNLLDATADQLLVLLLIFARIMPRLVNIYSRLQSLASTGPVLDVVAAVERESVAAAEPTIAGHVRVSLERDIRFDAVSFRYLRRDDTLALEGLELSIPAGLTTAIVGPSGAGKSTFTDLLIGLLRPTTGQILVDGTPLGPEHLESWRSQISYVAQETFLFHDTVRANLIWARPGSSDAELWDSLRQAAADEFVAALPQGLDTVVGERGVLLSGGERQRLSLARALLRRPRVLVLDEATSALDSETERRIQSAIDRLHHAMTIVIVTHRLSMISGADLIHVLDGGELAESGTWEMLNAPSGRFRDLCHAQGIYERPVRTAHEHATAVR